MKTPKDPDRGTALANYPELAAQFFPEDNDGRTCADVNLTGNKGIWWRCPAGPDHRWSAEGRSRLLGTRCPYCTNKRVSVTNNLLTRPDPAAQYFAEDNNGVRPEDITPGTRHKLTWRCDVALDHRWQASGNSRVTRGRGCPYCAGRLVSTSNSVASHPDLAAQYFSQDNGGVEPERVVAGTNSSLWWRCAKGPDHRWLATGSSRVNQGSGCPCCAGQQVSVTNNLRTRPDLAAQYFPEDNAGIRHEQMVAGTQRKLWWRCPVSLDHRWSAAASSRARGKGCPSCAVLQVSVTNNLLSRPELAKQYFAEDNDGVPAEQVVAGTASVLWWRCAAGPDHRWPATGANRARGRGCPFCAGRQPSVTNSIASTPSLATEYFAEDNDGLCADQVVAGSVRQLWWRCSINAGHRWKAQGNNRVKGTGCPTCSASRTPCRVRPRRAALALDGGRQAGVGPRETVPGLGNLGETI